MYCKNCGKEIFGDSDLCLDCAGVINENNAIEEAAQTVEEAPEVAAEEIIEEAPEAAAEEIVEEAPEAAAEEIIEEAPEAAAEEIIEEAPEAAAEEIIEEAPEAAAEEIIEEAPEATAEEIAQPVINENNAIEEAEQTIAESVESGEEKDTKYCPNCGNEVNENAIICVKCGIQLSNTGAAAEETAQPAINNDLHYNNINNCPQENLVRPYKPKKPFYKKWWFWLIVIVVFILFVKAIGSAASSSNTDYTTTEDTSYTESYDYDYDYDYTTKSYYTTKNYYTTKSYNNYNYSSSYVTLVKYSSPSAYPNITYGEAFGDFFSSPSWTSFTSTTGSTVVEFTGYCYYDGSRAKVLVQFTFSGSSFSPTYMSINGVGQNNITMVALIKKIFESY